MQHGNNPVLTRPTTASRNSNWLLLAVLLLFGMSAQAAPDTKLPEELMGLGVDEQIGKYVDLTATLTGENGKPVTLGSYFRKGRPVILNFVYYECPMLCNLVLNGLTSSLRQLKWTPGEEFDVVTVSIDPTESFTLAQKKKAVYLETYERPTTGWHWLTDRDGNVKRLADQVGFKYRYDGTQDQYAHPAALIILTPEGRVSRYLYGIKYRDMDMRLGLTEASESRLGNTVEKLLLFCFHYDPSAKSYVMFARNVMKLGGGLSVLMLGTVLYRLWRRDLQTRPLRGLQA